MLMYLFSIGSLSSYHFALILWGILIVVSLIVELITDELIIIWGTIGAVCSFIATLFHAPIWLQLLIFIVSTTLTILISRPYIKKYAKKEIIRTNADRILGMTAIVIEPFDNGGIGKISVEGKIWRAMSSSNESFILNEEVKIEGFSGTKVIVSKIINNEKIIRF